MYNCMFNMHVTLHSLLLYVFILVLPCYLKLKPEICHRVSKIGHVIHVHAFGEKTAGRGLQEIMFFAINLKGVKADVPFNQSWKVCLDTFGTFEYCSMSDTNSSLCILSLCIYIIHDIRYIYIYRYR